MIIICLLIIILCTTFTLLGTIDDISSKWIFSICVIGFAISIVGMIICVPDMIITHCNTNKKIYTKQTLMSLDGTTLMEENITILMKLRNYTKMERQKMYL